MKRLGCGVFLSLLLLIGISSGQRVLASLAGTVLDEDGAVLPDAKFGAEDGRAARRAGCLR
jgi:hypothetical protein